MAQTDHDLKKKTINKTLSYVTPPTSPAKNTRQCICNSWFGAFDLLKAEEATQH